jgi:glycerophosphoryl diester phosphodiesterase
VIAPLVIAHRGGGVLGPENTLATIPMAVRRGADGVEVDVLPTKDGRLVAHHDEGLTRTAGVPHLVRDLDYGELRKLDVGRWAGQQFAGERIPTLEEVAAALPSPLRLVADIKHGEERFPGLVRRMAEFARAFGPKRFAVLSIQHAFVAALAEAAPEIVALNIYRAPPAADGDLEALRALPRGVGVAVALRALSTPMLATAREADRSSSSSCGSRTRSSGSFSIRRSSRPGSCSRPTIL